MESGITSENSGRIRNSKEYFSYRCLLHNLPFSRRDTNHLVQDVLGMELLRIKEKHPDRDDYTASITRSEEIIKIGEEEFGVFRIHARPKAEGSRDRRYLVLLRLKGDYSKREPKLDGLEIGRDTLDFIRDNGNLQQGEFKDLTILLSGNNSLTEEEGDISSPLDF